MQQPLSWFSRHVYHRDMSKGERNGRGLIVTAVLLVLVSAGLCVERGLFLYRAIRADGVILRNHSPSSEVRRQQYFAVVRYFDRSGNAHELRDTLGDFTPAVLGRVVPVYYDPSDPAAGRIGAEFYWKVPGGMVAMAILFALLGFIGILIGRWQKRFRVRGRAGS